MRSMRFLGFSFICCVFVSAVCAAKPAASPSRERLSVMFLGDNFGHRPALRAQQALAPLHKMGIDLFYTDDVNDLNLDNLRRFDAVIFYANHLEMAPAQERALLDYVAEGGGFVPLHCAAGMFRNSSAYIELVGAAFASHGVGIVRTERPQPTHPALRDVPAFESWDETYLHKNHNPDRTVLEVHRQGDHAEPWTWVRTHGKGRVFYTAWGHDERTWSNPGFHRLIAQGVKWAAGDRALNVKPDAPPFKYQQAALPSLDQVSTVEKESELRPMQLPLGIEESMKRMVVPPGFEVKLFAAEPDIVKPIYMAWDERGRLWIAEAIDYPNDLKEDGSPGRDRIKILEDTNGDGRADKIKIFAEGLSIPTSFAFTRDGVIVTQAPYTLLLKDTNGDDKADVRKVLFSGWGTSDTHAGPNNLRMGFDNWLWGTVGYAGFEGTVGGEQHKFSMGFYRMKPDGSKLEFLRQTNNNTWGLGFTEEGIAFASTANCNPSVHMPFPSAYYGQVNGWSPPKSTWTNKDAAEDASIHPITERVRQVDCRAQYTAAAGHALYTARSFPKEYWNRMAFVADPTVHLLGQFAVQSDGSGYKSLNKWNMLASDDEWTGPIAAEVGPDGALWMIDWYTFIPQHNSPSQEWKAGKNAGYITDLRDYKHGRIYRIVHKQAPPYRPLNLAKASPKALVAALRNDNLFWRLTAQRLLVERGKQDVVTELVKLTKDRSVDAIGLNVGAIHALWTLQGLGALSTPQNSALVIESLDHPSAAVRRTAVQLAPATESAREAMMNKRLLEDEDGRVRLAALLALSAMPASNEVGTAVFYMLTAKSNFEDKWIPDAAVVAGAKHASGFLGAAATVDTMEDSVRKIVGQVSFHQIKEQMSGKSGAHLHAAPAGATLRRGGVRPDRNGVVTVTVGDDLAFDIKLIEAKAGEKIKIRLVNGAVNSGMIHNLVLLKRAQDINEVGAAAITATDHDYIPPQHGDKIIAHTRTAQPAETVEVTLTVPPPGEYPYVCTFPGHYVAMQGALLSTQ